MTLEVITPFNTPIIYTKIYSIKPPIKLSHYSPGHALRLQDVEAPRISRKSAHECGKVVSLTHRPPLPPPPSMRYP
jgi:hypothetical protein